MNRKRIIDFLLRHEYLIWILSFNALLRLPSLLEPYWYGDEGIYLTLGIGIRKGLELYKEIHDNKPPLLYFLAALSGSVFWFRLLLLAWHSISIIVFNRIAIRIFDMSSTSKHFFIGKVRFPPLHLSTLATALFALLPVFVEGNIANGEIFQLLPIVFGMILLWRARMGETSIHSSSLFVAASGISFSLAFLFKVPALLETMAAGVFFFIVVPLKNIPSLSLKQIRSALSSVFFSIFRSVHPYLFIFSFLLPILLTVGYYTLAGVGDFYVRAAFLQNVGYLSSWQTGSHEEFNSQESGMMGRVLVLLSSLGALTILGKFLPAGLILSLIWFACALFGSLLSGRPYPHYLINCIPPFALLVTFGVQFLSQLLRPFVPKFKQKMAVVSLGLIILAIAVGAWNIKKTSFWYYPILPYYKNYLSFITGNRSKDAYFSYFDSRLPHLYSAAVQIQQWSSPGERIFIWGDLPTLYALSKRLPVGRYTSAYHIKDFNGFDETLAAMQTLPPALIIIDTLYPSPFEGLPAFLDRHYVRISSTSTLWIYKHLDRQE